MFELKPNHQFRMLKLLYFPLRARGEALRMLLHHAKIPFVNQVVSFREWPALQPTVPNNQLPQLQLGHNDELLPHAREIALHVARLHGQPLLPVDEPSQTLALDCWQELHSTSLPFVCDPWGDGTPSDARIGAVDALLNVLPVETALPLVPRYLKGLPPWLCILDERLQRANSRRRSCGERQCRAIHLLERLRQSHCNRVGVHGR